MSCTNALIKDLKARREALGWSAKEVADRCGIDERFLAEWERGAGSPRLDAVETWAAAVGLRLAVVAGQQDSRPGLRVDWRARRLTVDGAPVRLTPMEWKALERLAAAPGELVTHEDLYRHLYGESREYQPQSTAIRVLITKLRRLLPLRIEARWGRGYVLSGIEPCSLDAVGCDAVAAPCEPEEAPKPIHPRREAHAVVGNPVRLNGTRLTRQPAALGRVEVRHSPVTRPGPCRSEELSVIERFLAERGATRCPDVATIQRSPLPTLVWDKMKRKWVRPQITTREAS